MIVAYDESWAGVSGIGRVFRNVIDRRPTNVDLIPINRNKNNASPLTPFYITKSLRRLKPDVFWSPGFMPPLLPEPNTKIVITIHDLTHLHFYSYFHKLYYNFVLKKLYSNVDSILTVSEYSKNEILDWTGCAESKVTRIYNGVDNVFFHDGKSIDLGCQYFFYAGNRREYKNIDRMLEAFSKTNLVDQGYKFVLTGNYDSYLQSTASKYGIENFVMCTGLLSDIELASYYKSALCVCFVSLYEGFGLPILEAMASGTPVITSNVASMPEIASKSALLVDPFSVDSIKDAMVTIANNQYLRESLIRDGVCRARDFTWSNCANMYWDTILSPL